MSKEPKEDTASPITMPKLKDNEQDAAIRREVMREICYAPPLVRSWLFLDWSLHVMALNKDHFTPLAKQEMKRNVNGVSRALLDIEIQGDIPANPWEHMPGMVYRWCHAITSVSSFAGVPFMAESESSVSPTVWISPTWIKERFDFLHGLYHSSGERGYKQMLHGNCPWILPEGAAIGFQREIEA